MRKSNNKKTRDVTAFIYLRLSRDDNLEGESYSIGNQKKLLTKAAKDLGYTNIVTFIDDGVSGVTMNRPGFNDMMQQLEENRAAALLVKDLSRLGRNYIEVGRTAGAATYAALNDGFTGEVGSSFEMDAFRDYEATTYEAYQSGEGTAVLAGVPYVFYKDNMAEWIPVL